MPDVLDAFSKSGDLHCTTNREPQSVTREEGGKVTVVPLVLSAVCLFGFPAGHISQT